MDAGGRDVGFAHVMRQSGDESHAFQTLARGRELGRLCHAWGLNSATKQSDWGHGTPVPCAVAQPISFRSVLGERLILAGVFSFYGAWCRLSDVADYHGRGFFRLAFWGNQRKTSREQL